MNVGQVVSVKPTSASKESFKAVAEQGGRPAPKWLEFDAEKLTGKVVALPEREDIDLTIEEHYIVELYSK